MANVRLLFQLIALAVAVAGVRAHLTERECNRDSSCKSHEFCNIDEQRCQRCVNCSKINRQFSAVECPRSAQDCGNCFTGYYIVFGQYGESTEVLCEKGRKLFTRTLSSTNATDSNADDSDAVPVWVYALCVIAGLCLGFAVGGIGGILAYKLYFQRKRHRKRENPKDKSVELHEMQPETRKYSSDSRERDEIAYGLIVNNTKHFLDVKDPDSRRDQELIPLQGNAAPVVSNNLYCVDEDNKRI